MGIRLDQKEIRDVFQTLNQVAEGLDSRNLIQDSEKSIHNAILESMSAQSSLIPKDSGALAQSLLNPKDRAHIFTIENNSIQYGSSLPQAKFQKGRIPSPSTSAIVDAVSNSIDKIIKGDKL